MLLSASSVFITLIMVSIMISLFVMLLSYNKFILLLRIDLLIVLAAVIMVRLFLPIEFPFTITVPFPQVMNVFQMIMGYELFSSFTVLHLLCTAEVIGFIVQLLRYIINLRKTDKIISILSSQTSHKMVSDYLCVDSKWNYPVWIGKEIVSPFIIGFQRIIFLPEINMTSDEIKNVLRHELQHIKNHDNIIKQMLNILKMIYWWFPPIYCFSDKVQLALEMRVDRQITKEYTRTEIYNYVKTLLELKEKIILRQNRKYSNLSASSNFLIGDNPKVLTCRIHYLLESDFQKRSNIIFLCVLLVLPFLSNSIVFEAYFPASNNGIYSEEYLIDQGFLVDNKDGTYTLIIDDNSTIIHDPAFYLQLGVKIKES